MRRNQRQDTNRRRPPQTSAELDSTIDDLIERYGTRDQAAVGASLYHYTTRRGFRGILSTRCFWAVAHSGAVKDTNEGMHAETTIARVLEKAEIGGKFAERAVVGARELRTRSSFTSTTTYRVGISCFTTVFDGEKHWRKHARIHEGPGFCMRIPILYEPFEIPHVGLSVVRVVYDLGLIEARLRNAVTQVLKKAEPRNDVALAASGIARLCDVSAMMVKPEDCSWEAEYRRIAISEQGHDDLWRVGPPPHMELPVRGGNRPLEMDTIVVAGTDDDVAETETFLREQGYGSDGLHMPIIKRRIG